MAKRVYWWQTAHPGECSIVVVAVLATGLSNATALTRRAGFHGLKTRTELGPPPDWVVETPTAHPGQVCWCPTDCTAPENWRVATADTDTMGR